MPLSVMHATLHAHACFFTNLRGDGGVGHGRGHGDQAVDAAEAHGDLEQLGHLFGQKMTKQQINIHRPRIIKNDPTLRLCLIFRTARSPDKTFITRRNKPNKNAREKAIDRIKIDRSYIPR